MQKRRTGSKMDSRGGSPGGQRRGRPAFGEPAFPKPYAERGPLPRRRAHREDEAPGGEDEQNDDGGPRRSFAKPFDKEPVKPASEKQVHEKFNELWKTLFSSPVHLDSALSKLPRNMKTTLAQIVPQILLRPVSQAEAMGIGVAPGEPWTLSPPAIALWRPAQVLGQRLYGMMSQGVQHPSPQPEDYPKAMIAEWEAAWGRESMLELASTLGREAPLSLRATRKIGAESLLKKLKAGSWLPVKAELSNFTPLGVRLAGYAPVLGTGLYKEGLFEIQDEGSQLMALFALWPELFGKLLQKKPGQVRAPKAPIEVPTDVPAWTVVDACAGAGGKALALSDAMGGKGRVYAYDVSAVKLQALRRRATHAGLNNIQAVVLKEGEEEKTIGKFRRRAHAVLVDAPCSGWGVLRRNPDIKWRQSNEALKRLPEIQLRLLSQYSTLVAGEGRLIYGTCTFRKEETTDIVQRFLEAHPEFEAREGGFLGPGPCDGFFMQCFVRRKGGPAK